MTAAVLPGVQWIVDEGSTAVFKADPGAGKVRLAAATEPVRDFFRQHVYLERKELDVLGKLADPARLRRHIAGQRLSAAILVPLCVSARRIAGGVRLAAALAAGLRRPTAINADLCAQAMPWRGRRGARRGGGRRNASFA